MSFIFPYINLALNLGKLFIHPLNFNIVAITPSQLLFYPIYSLNFVEGSIYVLYTLDARLDVIGQCLV